MSKFKTSLFISVTCLLLTHETAEASSPSPRPVKPLCRLEIQNAHLSTTLQRHRKINAVKVNVSSICNVEQSQVLITLEIHKKGEFNDHVYGPFINDQSRGKNSGMTVILQDKYVLCKNSILTRWFGVAYSKAFINGKWQYAGRTNSPRIEPLLCGT